MSSFSSGVMISKSEADRRKGDEARMRKQGIDPSKGEDLAWGGAVICRRQHKATRVDKEAEKDREEAEALSMDADRIVAKRPDGRLRWLQRALVLASKGRGHVSMGVVYDIVTQAKFTSGVSHGIGTQMRAMLFANLHLFSSKQQRAFQSDASRFSSFTSGKDSDGSGEERRRGASPPPKRAARRSASLKRARRRDSSSASPRRRRGGERRLRSRSGSAGSAGSAGSTGRPSVAEPARSRNRSRSRRSRRRSRSRGGRRGTASAGGAATSATVPGDAAGSAAGGVGGSGPAVPAAAPAPAQVKMKMTKWQPLHIRNAVAAVSGPAP